MRNLKLIKMESNTNLTDEDKELMIKWFRRIIFWFLLLIVSTFYIPWTLSFGIWLFITGTFMHFNRKRYAEWKDKVFPEEKE